MNKGLEELEKLGNEYPSEGDTLWSQYSEKFSVIEKELKDKEKQENVLKTISDIIRDFKKGEFANGECALEEISNMLREVLL